MSNSEPTLVNFIGLSYSGYICRVVAGDVTVCASVVVGVEAIWEPHANDCGA